jgi:hypothetical protein
MKVRSLSELKTLHQVIAQRAAAEAAAREAERLRVQRLDRERRLFELAVGPVQPWCRPAACTTYRARWSPRRASASWTKPP